MGHSVSRTFVKLFSGILDSTVWSEPLATRVTWITMLSMADRRGRVFSSVPGLANRARVSLKQAEAALERFLAPDAYSRTPEHEGRRIEEIDGGWILFNYTKYREMRDHEERLEQQRRWDREHRQRRQNPTQSDRIRPRPTHAYAEAEALKSKPLAPSASHSTPAGHLNGRGLQEETVERIPLCDKTEFEVRQSFVEELDRLYPAVDPVQTLREIRGWCIGNPTRTKTKRGVKAFITSWFAREQDKQSRSS